MSASDAFDLLVVGGGINGVGIARDAAGRGLRVLLVEQAGLASHTYRRHSKTGLNASPADQLRLVAYLQNNPHESVLEQPARTG